MTRQSPSSRRRLFGNDLHRLSQGQLAAVNEAIERAESFQPILINRHALGQPFRRIACPYRHYINAPWFRGRRLLRCQAVEAHGGMLEFALQSLRLFGWRDEYESPDPIRSIADGDEPRIDDSAASL